MDSNKSLRHGDRVSALGITCTIDRVIYQDHFGDRPPVPGSDCWGYDAEFIDARGAYHHWKQNQDGGAAFRWDGRGWRPIIPDADADQAPVPAGWRILRRFRNNCGFTAWIEECPEAYAGVRLKVFTPDDYKVWESEYSGAGAVDHARMDLITRAAGIWTEAGR